MSIPRVLVLSILLLPPQADAQEMKDPFARIRQALKYWRTIYYMYHDELTLGYCWAEYFLQLGENMETMPVSYPVTLDPSTFGATKQEKLRRAKADRIVRDTREDWLIPFERPRKRARHKRSSGISSTKRETSMTFGKSDEMRPLVQKSAKSIVCHLHASRHVRGDKRREFSDPANVTSPFSLSSLSNASRSTKLEGFAKSKKLEDEGRLSTSKIANFKEHSAIEPELHFTDYYQLTYPRVRRAKNREFSDFSNVTSLLNIVKEVILKIFRDIAKTGFKTKDSDPPSAISVHLGSKSNSRYRNSSFYFRRHKNRQYSDIDIRGSPSFLFPSPDKSPIISKTQKSAVAKGLSTGKSASSDGSSKVAEVYFKSMDASHRSHEISGDDVGKSSISLSSSLNIFTEDGRLPVWNSEKVVKTPFDSKFKDSRAVREKSKDLEENTHRKVLYLKTRHATSADSPRCSFSFRLSQLRDQRSLVARSLRRIASLNDSEDTHKIEKLDDIKPCGFPSKMKFNSSNPYFQEIGQRFKTSKGNRREIRHKRDASDQIRDSLIRPPTFAMKSFDKVVRYFPSWVYVTPKRSGWKGKIKPKIHSKNHGERNTRRKWRREDFQRSFMNSAGHYSKYYTNILQTNQHLTFIPIGTKEFPKFKNVYNIASFTSNPGTSTNYMLLNNPTEDDWWKEDSDKESLTVNNRYRRNRYQGAESSFLLEKSASEKIGKKEPIQYPMGGSSLLSNSYRRFMGDYGRLTSGTSRNSRPNRTWRVVKGQGLGFPSTMFDTRGLTRSMMTVFNFREAFIEFLRALGFFVQVGRQIIDYFDSNSALMCTKEYMWNKFTQWIDA